MKKVTLFSTAAFLVLAVSSSVFAQNAGMFHLAVQAGLGYAQNRDMNHLVAGFGDETAADVNAWCASHSKAGGFEGSETRANWNYGIDLEPRLFFGSFGVSMSVGYHATSRAESSVESPNWRDSASISMQMKVVPVCATVYYRADLGDSAFMLLGAGAGYYRATLKYHDVDNISVSYYYGYDETFTFKGDTVGYHARVEFDYLYGPIAFYAGVMGRYVNIDNFERNGAPLKNSDGTRFEAGLTGIYSYFGAAYMI